MRRRVRIRMLQNRQLWFSLEYILYCFDCISGIELCGIELELLRCW